MSLVLRLILLAGAVFSCIYFIYMIRKRRLQIDYALFWVLFSILLVLFAALPGVVSAIAELLGFESASNFVFLTIIFLLILRLFSVTLKLSRLNQQITDLTQRLAILQKQDMGSTTLKGAAMTALTTRLPEEDKALIKSYAELHGTSVAERPNR